MDKKTALITGASSGLGLAFARIFGREGFDLVLVARSEDKLKELAIELKSKHGTQSTVVGKDLSVPGSPDEVYAEIQQKTITVDVLINNAGFADYGYFVESDLSKQLQMMQLNIVTLTHLTRLCLPAMKQRGYGKIMNVASTAAFAPGPLMAVYYASKAYVLSFSEAIAAEMQGTGVTVTALCPGPTESGFQQRAAMQDSKLVQGRLMSAQTVAEIGYNGLMKGEHTVIPGFMNQVQSFMPRLLPRNMAARVVMNMQQRVAH
jgi:short-subunit dehydrogenase